MSTLLITMAGESSRFRQAGYEEPKYRLQVHGHTLFWWSISSLQNFIDNGWKLVFVGRSNDTDLDHFIDAELQRLNTSNHRLLSLDEPTDGQATTALAAQDLVEPDAPLVIYNIDTFVEPAQLHPNDMRGSGWIPCFPGDGDGWSFLATNIDGNVTEVREKVRISDHATIGLYGFDSFATFAKAYASMRNRTGTAEQKERYIAPLYNELIGAGSAVTHHCLPKGAVVPLGTPGEVETFRQQSR